MSNRKPISASIRWSIFARDGFCCRYCGAQAGQDGVELAVDHVVSVADGGDNSTDNLVTACRRCNGGKSARSLGEIPTPQEVIDRVSAMRGRMSSLVDEMQAAAEARAQAHQMVVDIKCRAYKVSQTTIVPGEVDLGLRIVGEFGGDKLIQFYEAAAGALVQQTRAVQYVGGCARRTRERAMEEHA